MSTVGNIAAMERVIHDIRELIANAESWQHNQLTRQIERRLAEHDGTLDAYRKRMREERARELGILDRRQAQLDAAREWVEKTYQTATAASPRGLAGATAELEAREAR